MNRIIRCLLAPLGLLLAVAFLAACGSGDSSSSDTSASDTSASDTSAATSTSETASKIDLSARCPGPNGSPAASPDELSLSPKEIQEVRKGNYTAAVTWAGPGPWYAAVDRGFDEALQEFNIDRVATTQADYDPGKQAAQVSAVMAKDPDVVLGSPVDADAGAEIYREVVDSGKVLVLSDNVPTGYVAGKDYVGFASGNRCEGGALMADAISDAIGGSGEIGMVNYDGSLYVTNTLDEYFQANIEQRYPDVTIAEKTGFSQENATQDVASAMVGQNPDIKGIYVTWSIPAEGVIAALRASGKNDVSVVTHDLNPTNDVNLAEGEGPMAATVSEQLLNLGQTLGVMAAYGLLEKKAPAFVAVPYVVATPESIVDVYTEVEGLPAPDEVVAAADGNG